MKILIYGAGVLGSIFAGKLFSNGEDVSILARGETLSAIQDQGIIINDVMKNTENCYKVPVVDSINPDDEYDLVLVIMRKNQIDSILPILEKCSKVKSIAFLGNNVDGIADYEKFIEKDKILLGFAAAAGYRKDGKVYSIYSDKPGLVIGEPNGELSERIKEIEALFSKDGFDVMVQENIDAWLKYHAALVIPIALGIYASGGDNYRLAKTPAALRLMYKAVKENFKMLKDLKYPVTPSKLKIFVALPDWLALKMYSKKMATKNAEISVAGHANAARDEMTFVADGLNVIAKNSDIKRKSNEYLYRFVDPDVPAIDIGLKKIDIKK